MIPLEQQYENIWFTLPRALLKQIRNTFTDLCWCKQEASEVHYNEEIK